MTRAALVLCAAVVSLACGGAATPGGPALTASPTAAPTAATASPGGSPTAKPSPLRSDKGLIVVSEPLTGDSITSPVTIAGEASVFEATVSFRIVTSGGTVLGQGHTTASEGAPQRGTFKAEVSFDTPLYGESGFVEVFERSAKDGSITEIVRVPVSIPGTY